MSETGGRRWGSRLRSQLGLGRGLGSAPPWLTSVGALDSTLLHPGRPMDATSRAEGPLA